MLYNYDYRLPIIESTYKSSYGKGRKDIIDHNEEYYNLKNYSLYKINKTIKLYDKVIYELHDVSIYNLTSIEKKIEDYREIIMRNLNLILGKVEPNELEIITIEHYFMDRKEKLMIIKEAKEFERKMEKLAKTAIAKKQVRCKKN